MEVAQRYGLTEEELDTALASFARSKDRLDQGIAAYFSGDPGRAESFLEEAVEEKEAELQSLAEALLYLGLAQHDQGKLEEAASTLRRAEALNEADSEVQTFLALMLLRLGELPEAEKHARCALELVEETFGPDDPEVAVRLLILAAVLKEQERYEESERLARRAVAGFETSLGPDDLKVAVSLDFLAEVLLSSAELDPALMERSAAVFSSEQGPQLEKVKGDLSQTAEELEDAPLDESLARMKEKIRELQGSTAAEDDDAAAVLLALAQGMSFLERLTKAGETSRKSVEVYLRYEHRHGEAHPWASIAVDRYRRIAAAVGATGEEIDSSLSEMRRKIQSSSNGG